ncbi:MAG TPA: hypothetical protein VIC04_09930, partial [Terriglobia bacterium]
MEKTFAFLDTLPGEVLSQTVNSSFSSILATVQHVYRADCYFLTLMQGGYQRFASIPAPDAYGDLKLASLELHAE